MSLRTPGRARRGEEAHLAYNADPKTVGTRTNAPMPTGVARLSDGFEDPAAFFSSPTNTEYASGSGSRSIASVFSKGIGTPKTPAGRSDYTAHTPMTGDTSFGTLRRTRSRMSDIDPEERDKEDEEMLEDDLLNDEDDLQAATPKYFATESNPPSIALPSRSRLPVSSPAVDRTFDAIPSPRARSSLRKSNLSAHSGLRNGGRVSDMTGESPDRSGITNQDEDEDEESPRRGTRKSTRLSISPTVDKKNKRQSSRVPDSQPDELSYTSHSGSSRRKSTKSNGHIDREASISDNDGDMDIGGPSFDDDIGGGSGGGDDTMQDLGNDDNNDFDHDNDIGNGGDIGDDIGGNLPESDGEEDDIGLEQDAIDQENEPEGDDDDDEQQSTPRVDKERKKKSVVKKRTAQKKSRTDENAPPARTRMRQGSVAPKPKRTRISQIGVSGDASDEDREDGYHGNFQCRRSSRTHFKPLDWWRGEKFEYRRGPGLPVIAEVITIPEETPQPLSARHKKTTKRANSTTPSTKKRSRSRQDSSSEHEVEEEAGWDDETEPTGLVKTFPEGMESHRKIACPKALLNPESKANQNFSYQKVFGEGDFMAAGVVMIPVGKSKTTKPSKDNAYVFYVIQGAVQVQIYRTSFIMAPGGQFIVPRGNEYSIENISNKEVQLFFAQARKVKATEQELEAAGASTPRASSVGVPNGKAKKQKVVKQTRPGSEDEEEDDY
ncbi:uncharacterized protein L199_000584 [Kwoniella botswanensis]|uniref:uncharacterized protein n=1 Tax=Kwoniella botswanensis TaxID=1268659 RepID=UPI00315D4C4B